MNEFRSLRGIVVEHFFGQETRQHCGHAESYRDNHEKTDHSEAAAQIEGLRTQLRRDLGPALRR